MSKAVWWREILPTRIAGVVFDCDGVLIDSRMANIAYYNRIREIGGLDPMNPDEENYAHMHSVRETLLHIFPQEMHERLGEFARHVDYEREILPMVHPEPGLHDCLDALCTCGVRLAVFTNRGSGMGAVLDSFNLRPYFDLVMTVADVKAKPAPDGLLRIAENWKHPPGDLIFVGDSLLDAMAAEAAGVCFLAYRNPSLQAKGHVESFLNLEQAIREVSLESTSVL
ncbi:MAG: HAD family hydrolase [Betaproteobacteria bacterium]|nr:HAD family hydrolase [Betaproteobacteria bacterium]